MERKQLLLVVSMLVSGAALFKVYSSVTYQWNEHWRIHRECVGDRKGIDAYHSMLEDFKAPMVPAKKYAKR